MTKMQKKECKKSQKHTTQTEEMMELNKTKDNEGKLSDEENKGKKSSQLKKKQTRKKRREDE